jgi:hypothetical protein
VDIFVDSVSANLEKPGLTGITVRLIKKSPPQANSLIYIDLLRTFPMGDFPLTENRAID